MKGITVTAETYGAHDDGPDVIAVRVDGREVGAYCIADDAEAERASMERMVRAIYRAGMREGFEAMKESAQRALDQVQQARYEQTKRLQATSVRRPIPQPRQREWSEEADRG